MAAPSFVRRAWTPSRLLEDLTETTLSILVLAVFLAILVLAVQFDSARYPLLTLSCIPMSAAGMIFALSLTDLALGATVLVGVLVVVAAAAVREASRRRLRPRVMTTATTIAGLLPLALNARAATCSSPWRSGPSAGCCWRSPSPCS